MRLKRLETGGAAAPGAAATAVWPRRRPTAAGSADTGGRTPATGPTPTDGVVPSFKPQYATLAAANAHSRNVTPRTVQLLPRLLTMRRLSLMQCPRRPS